MRDTAKKDKEEVMTEENGEGVDENETNKRLIILLQKKMLMMTTEMHVIAASSGDRRHGVDLILFTWSNFDFVLVLKEWNTIFGSIMDMALTPQVLNRRRMGWLRYVPLRFEQHFDANTLCFFSQIAFSI